MHLKHACLPIPARAPSYILAYCDIVASGDILIQETHPPVARAECEAAGRISWIKYVETAGDRHL